MTDKPNTAEKWRSTTRYIGRRVAAAGKWGLIIALSILLFMGGKGYALRERGYEAAGGEHLFLFIPAIYYAAERILRDWIKDL